MARSSGLALLIFALVGLAFFGAVFASFVYSFEVREVERRPAFGLSPGQVQADYLEPSIAGGEITVNLTVNGGAIDVWVMDQEWIASTVRPGADGIDLTQPFSYYAAWSVQNITDQYNFTFIADGQTRLALALDYSDAYYDDTPPGDGPIEIEVRTRYLEEEQRSLVLGYLAAVPSVLLIGITLGRKIRRVMRERKRD